MMFSFVRWVFSLLLVVCGSFSFLRFVSLKVTRDYAFLTQILVLVSSSLFGTLDDISVLSAFFKMGRTVYQRGICVFC